MTTIKDIQNKAEQLATIRASISSIEEDLKVKIVRLKTERDAMQIELIDILKENDLTSIKVSTGESYARAKRKSLNIIDLTSALEWATDNEAISVDKKMAEQMLKNVEKLPKGFEQIEKEYITIRKPKVSN